MFAARKTDNVSSAANYIEECFSVYLYTGNGSTQTITNGIDLSGKGGLVWLKKRSSATGGSHRLMDTVRGGNKLLSSNTTGAESTSNQVTFLSSGFDVIDAVDNGATYASWTFRKQAKFFDVVTYTGTGSAQTINHNLGSVPGCIIIKCTSSAADWPVYHRGLTDAATTGIYLNATDAAFNVGSAWWNSTAPTSTQFSVGTSGNQNNNGATYVAYLFAHDAGGFGAAGSDNVISCGSYTGNGSADGPSITLGYEAAWVMTKNVTTTGNWQIQDVMRGMPLTSASNLMANLSDAEDTDTSNPRIFPTATGFKIGTANARVNTSGQTYIYIAIRRGPMKTPTSGTSVYGNSANTSAIDASNAVVFNPEASDLWFNANRANYIYVLSKLNGWRYLVTQTTANENTSYTWEQRTQTDLRPTTTWWSAGQSQVNWFFKRAPGFFDVVCYTGTAAAQTQSHNLGVAPELMIVKRRSAAASWAVYSSALGNTKSLELNSTGAVINSVDLWNSTTPTSSVFSIGGSDTSVNASGSTYVAYLFATVAGVSKVGSYTGTGTTKQIDCGFTAGSRFVMIKRTDSTGDWYVWDSARGIVSGNDPYLLMNSAAAEVTNTDYIDPLNAGFEISSTAPAAINANGGTFIFLAIA